MSTPLKLVITDIEPDAEPDTSSTTSSTTKTTITTAPQMDEDTEDTEEATVSLQKSVQKFWLSNKERLLEHRIQRIAFKERVLAELDKLCNEFMDIVGDDGNMNEWWSFADTLREAILAYS